MTKGLFYQKRQCLNKFNWLWLFLPGVLCGSASSLTVLEKNKLKQMEQNELLRNEADRWFTLASNIILPDK